MISCWEKLGAFKNKIFFIAFHCFISTKAHLTVLSIVQLYTVAAKFVIEKRIVKMRTVWIGVSFPECTNHVTMDI